MMILPLLPFFIFFFFIKEIFFWGLLVSLESSLTLLFSIFPLILFLVLISNFNFVTLKEKSFFFFIFCWVLTFLFFCFNSLSSIFFLISLENCVILMIFLIFWFSKDLDKISSTLFMFFINIFPSILFMYFCWSWEGSPILGFYLISDSSSILCFFCFLGLLVSKLPLFFFHFWLTKAHVSASGCGSMILASLMLKIGSIGLFKFYYLFLSVSKIFSSFFFSLVSFSSFILLVIMVRFFDLKYLVACSSIVHMAPILPLCLWGEVFSVYSSILMMVGHGLVSYFIFYLVSLIYEKSYNRSIDFNKSTSNYSSLMLIFTFFFFLLNLGFPPFCSFISELYFLRSFFTVSNLLGFFFCSTLMLSGLIFFFVLSKSLFGKKVLYMGSTLNVNIYFFFHCLCLYFFIYSFCLLLLL